MSESTRPDAEQLVNDYEALLNGDLSKLDVLSQSFTFYGPGMPEEGLDRDAFEEYVRGNREAFDDALPNTSDVTFDGHGHATMLTAPDRFIDEVRTFVREVTDS